MKIDAIIFKSFLKINKVTITKFASEINVSRDTINNWINRNGNIPDWKAEIIKEYIIDIYGYCPDDLFFK